MKLLTEDWILRENSNKQLDMNFMKLLIEGSNKQFDVNFRWHY